MTAPEALRALAEKRKADPPKPVPSRMTVKGPVRARIGRWEGDRKPDGEGGDDDNSTLR